MSLPVEGGGLSVPDGDPASLRAAARELSRTAELVGGAGRTVRSEGAHVVGGAGWTGSAADAFTGRYGRLAAAVSDVEPPLRTMATALTTYADALEAAQTRARAAIALAQTSHSLPPEDAPGVLRTAQQDAGAAASAAAAAAAVCAAAVGGATGLLPDRRDAPPEVRETEGEQREAPTLYEFADKLNAKLGFFVSPVAAGLAAREGQVWAEAVRDMSAAPALARSAAFSDIVSTLGLAYDRGEVTIEALQAGFQRYLNVSDAVDGLSAVKDYSQFESLATGGVRDAGLIGGAGRFFAGAGVFSDVLTLYNPGTDNAVEGGANRAAALANIAGSATILAPELSTTAVAGAAGLLGVDAAVGWVPVAGQIVVAATGLYLAGDWAYHNVAWFHDGVDSTVHAIGTAATDTAHAVATVATEGARLVSQAAQDDWHAATTVASGALHGAEDLAQHLNPFHW